MTSPQTRAASKKRKVEAAKDDNSSHITRSPDLWFNDGTVIIQAETTHFRVHRDFIARHSEVFCDMFKIPQPADESSKEPCQVVEVFGDRAKDWENLLKAMYNCYNTQKLPEEYPIERVISLLLLGNKYHFNFYRDIAIARLRDILPIDSYTEWVSNNADRIKYINAHLFELANVVQEVGWTSLLPVIYLLCIRHSNTKLIRKGISQADGSLSVLPIAVQNMLIDARIALSREALEKTLFKPMSALYETEDDDESVDCTSEYDDCANHEKKNERVFYLLDNPGTIFDTPAIDLCYCLPCNIFVHAEAANGRTEMWEKLPSYFNLPEWDDLADLDNDD
ncbi:hypothetical protein JR316_0005563 [Psilocybe cubensis]|uniref:Uncharacterized protein n=2 Tax=Psilocybe cubensis TaxID=181762 RepID=A0ACB8GZN4_PSICU|nr:hypothetical protein JR316_0005563 [Psilocybe cubensis]KAH9481044.1 hypothetical protein JR316_0005563 [Psilocybe cubensis]